MAAQLHIGHLARPVQGWGREWVAALMLGLMALVSVPAQADSCRVPAHIPETRVVKVDCQVDAPVTGYVLALSWSPAFCDSAAGQRGSNDFQCRDNQFRWVVHGLWPQNFDSKGARCSQPRHCQATQVDASTVRDNLCIMPGVQLIQGEWQKHGSCAFDAPADYFSEIQQLWQRIQRPPLEPLAAGGRISTAAIKQAFIALNPGLGRDDMLVQAGKNNRFNEIFICLDKQGQFRRCNGNGVPDHVLLQLVQ
ncbi:hypothetical protein QCD60_15200 [Pokkaliibacter sp. MBI-7]|uniref:ribonuclease T2 family protein n=1 Tax=Pokkaliibacter sp. MBI-7 TaxID=3040600 RepID=UPI00244B2197|nr:hypothetical protein [Pokkaliibacter sp. MBI-7]MDH2433911.1 hypothetical protein [Pokkaliibacter sp. MBI-7]